MKITSSRGFTLIELVVVIVILGILAATAAPKFMSLQSDARAASLKGVEAALKSADKMFYAKAVMQGADKTCDFDHKVKIEDNWVYVCYGHVLPLSNTPGNFELDKVADIDIENDYSYVPDDGDDYLYGYYFFKNQEFEKITNTGERYSKYLELKDKCSVMYRLNQESGDLTIKSYTSDC
ncbi:type II secretion system protein [Succinimonas sp.]|uniref:type II secretion system protein n=1 Tax=Succinimonas sp. TaxID=1936151 RepID=UPI00386BBD44